MMKSFFKKLAFVMALAMVVSMVAPAGSALAAESGVSLQGTKTIVETYELDKVGATVDFSFQGAPKDWKTTYAWTSSNPAVATVDKAGVVTAVAAGTATITITAGADASYIETVVVTVKEEVVEVVPTFVAKQLNTTKVELTFAEGTDMSKAAPEDFAITAIDETFEYTLFANTVTANKNVVVLEFVDGVLADGAIIKIAYADTETTLVASNSKAVAVAIKYGMNPYGLAGDAYVYSDLDPDYVYLAYALYDKTGVDVTANYTNADFDNLEWSLVNGDEVAYLDFDGNYDMDMVCFEEKGVATVKLEITFVDEDGNDEVISTVTPIVAQNRPAIAFDFVDAGLFNPTAGYENCVQAVDSYNAAADGTIWNSKAYSGSIEKGKEAWFGALLVDNRGDDLVSTKLTHSYVNKNNVITGSTAYEEYGYFTYATSNDNIIDIDADGNLVAVGTGTATVLVSFVAVDEEGNELPAKKIGSKRITVYANPYPATFALTADTTTVTTNGSSKTGSVYLQIFDQFGNAMSNWAAWNGNGSDSVLRNAITVTAVSENYETITGSFASTLNPVWEQATGWTPAYKIAFDGSDFLDADLVKSGKYGTFKFDVTIDKETEDFEKVSTKSDRAFVKVYNVDSYYTDLNAFYAGNATVDVNKNYKVSLTKSSIDVWADCRSEFGDPNSTGIAPIKTASLSVSLLSSNGLKLRNLPAAYFLELPKDNGKYIETKNLTNPKEGAIYYTISTPKDAENVTITATNGAINFAFNETTASRTLEDVTGIPCHYNENNQLVLVDENWTSQAFEYKNVVDAAGNHVGTYLTFYNENDPDGACYVQVYKAPAGTKFYVTEGDEEVEVEGTPYVINWGAKVEAPEGGSLEDGANITLHTATTGNYTVTLYYVNSKGKLAKLDTKTINVSSSMDKVTYEGFVDGNVADGAINDNNILSVVEELCDFKWNGITLHDPWGRADFEILEVRGDDADGKFRVREIDFVLPSYYEEVAANGTVTYKSMNYTYTLKKNITIYDGE